MYNNTLETVRHPGMDPSRSRLLYTPPISVELALRPHREEQLTISPSILQSHINLIRLWLEAEFRIPLPVTEYGADADRREGDLSMNA